MAYYRVKVYYGAPSLNQSEYSAEFEYDLAALGVDSEEVAGAVTAAVAGMREVLLDVMQIYRAVASTWTPDSQPYDPTTFKVFNYSGIMGKRSLVGFSLAPLEETLKLDRKVATGRPGRLFVRGAFYEEEIAEAGEGWQLTNAGEAAVLQAIEDANQLWFAVPGMAMVGQSLIEKVYLPAEAGQKQQVLKVYGPPIARPVTQMLLGGVRNRQLKQ